MLALAADAIGRPDIATLAIGVFGAVIVLIGVVIFRFIYFDRSR
jgi:hypothetical protein